MNLLLTGAFDWRESEVQKLREKGHDICILQNEQDELPCQAQWVEGVICNALFLYHPIEKFRSLKYVQLTSVGCDRVPMSYFEENGITINNAANVYSIPMAEFAVFGVLELYKHGKFFANNQRAHTWSKHRGLLELSGKTVCIVGCGNVGNACAERFRAFGCKVIGVNRTLRRNELYDDMLPLEYLKEVLPESDVVVLAVALNEDTNHLMNRRAFEEMKKGAVFVNISRGHVTDETALIEALNCSKLFGAVLDVFEKEPLDSNSPLWEMENAVLMPHNSFVGEGNHDRLLKCFMDNLK